MKKTALVIITLGAVGLCLSGCDAAWIGEDRMRAMKKDWNRLGTTDWEEASRVDEVFPSQSHEELVNEERICDHPNTTNRVTTQDGVNDSLSYRHCPLSAYPTDNGARMGIRPDGQGSIFK
jgi:hypothetical protein